MAGAFSSNSMRSGKRRRAMADINVVPYIDVMLVLLVIFMTTAAFVPTGVIDVPKAGKANTNPSAFIEVQLKADGKLHIRTAQLKPALDQPVKEAQLGKLVQQLRGAHGADTPVVIAADESVAYKKVMDMLRNLQDQGIAKVSLLVKK
jgi:biopolymer transport protein TolR